MNPVIAQKFEANQEPGSGVANDKLGMWIFLASEVVFFAVLISAVVALSLRPESNWSLHQEPYTEVAIILATINTFILILSSVFVVSAIDAIQHGRQRWMLFWLFLTLLGGVAFLFNQSREWAELSHILHEIFGFAEGFAGAQESVYAASFYTVTGFHGAHVFIGVLLLLYVMMRALRGDFTPRKYNALEMFGLYWHFVDLVWIILFTILYLI
ncbi:MAG: cytochrome c oxidase subunit 3 [Chloroflexota bacterium]|nr:cytochrome c oxidase subunit 3 [Chloroflexota bacterium]